MTSYVDSHGKAIADYPHPSVAVDTAVLTVRDGVLCVVLVATGTLRRLPGTFLHEGETLADAVCRSLRSKAGLEGVIPVQLHVFDALDRDDRGWVLSVAHLAPVRAAALANVDEDVAIVPVTDVAALACDHDAILALAVAQLRALYEEHPDPSGLLGDKFTMLELQRLHEAIGPIPQRDTFRRMMRPMLVGTEQISSGTIGKPARVYRRA